MGAENIKNNHFFITIYILFFIISLFEVGSASASLAAYQHTSVFIIIAKQVLFLLMGFIFMIVMSRVSYKLFFKLADFIFWLAIFLLFITFLLGTSINNARRWITVPFFGINFQTSEFVKFAVILKVAKELSIEKDLKSNTIKILKKISIVVLPIVVVIMLTDNSTAFLLFFTVLLMLIVVPIEHKILYRYLVWIFLSVFFLFMIGYLLGIGRFSTMLSRALHFLQGKDYYQALQAKIAIATGQIFIPLPGSSTQKALLSHSYSDFIFAILNEETGLWGALVVLFLYLAILYKVGIYMKKIKRSFPMFFAIGLVFNILLQAFVHMAVNVGLLPITGQPLPLISLGGTSIIMTSISLGILNNIIQTAPYQATAKEKETQIQTSQTSLYNQQSKKDEWKDLVIGDFDI